MTSLLVLHVLAAVLAPLLVRWWGRQAFLVLAAVPGVAFGWVLAQLATVTGGGEVRETVPWIPALDLQISLRLDALALTFALWSPASVRWCSSTAPATSSRATTGWAASPAT